jgi:nitric oxide dioxygenase
MHDWPRSLDDRSEGARWAADVALVKTCFDHVWPVAGHAADRFYERLFEIAPHVRPLFRGDMTEQKRKFMATLAVIVGSLDDMSDLLPRAATLAQQHVLYGVEESHYPLIGEALLWTLEHELGPDWTPAAASAWRRTYETLSGYMIAQAYASRGPSTA